MYKILLVVLLVLLLVGCNKPSLPTVKKMGLFCEEIKCEDITIKNAYMGGVFIPDNSTCVYTCII